MQSIAVFSASPLFADYVELEGLPDLGRKARSHNSRAGLFNDYFLYREASLRIQSLTPATPCLPPGSPLSRHRATIQTLGEHGLLAGRFGQLARHGAHFGISTGLVNVRLAARI